MANHKLHLRAVTPNLLEIALHYEHSKKRCVQVSVKALHRRHKLSQWIFLWKRRVLFLRPFCKAIQVQMECLLFLPLKHSMWLQGTG